MLRYGHTFLAFCLLYIMHRIHGNVNQINMSLTADPKLFTLIAMLVLYHALK